MAEISWIKLKTTMFDDEKIRLIQSVPESDAILVIWIRLLVLAGKTNDDGLIYIQRNMPYTEEMLATLFGKNVNTIRLALTTLEGFNMIDLGKDGLIAITNWEKHQNVEGMDKVRLQNAERNRRYRERKKQLALNSGDVSMTSRDGTDKELDKDKDKELDKDINTKSGSEEQDVIPYKEIVDYLNLKANKKYRHSTPKSRSFIKARWNEGFRLDEFKKVIDNKCFDWMVPGKKINGTPAINYLRPETLFGTKFESYLNENVMKGASQRDTTEYDNLF
ncbi:MULTISPECIES: phage replisome organizer N-terminal domain-containing protein [Vagococcus]|uniref:phage replisome organizer N-terminal domain-containing protein n=1 Tax=Vagococcus TaxID=2737 RepID=UPI000E4F36E9|nr:MULTISPECIES: phage replisome organizer N-terminal domain-containing protein [Vagococcus]RHH70116.1 replication protein [Vagococcus sp. AM17-17]